VSLAETVAFHRDPLAFLRKRQRNEGDVFTVELTFVGPTTVVAEPEAAILLLGSDPESAEAGRARRGVVPMASERSVFGGDGTTHGVARRRLAPAFAPEAMSARGGAIAAIAERHAAAWPRGRPVQLLSRMRTLADDVFVRVMLGVVDERRAAALVDSLGALLRIPGNPPLPPPGPENGAPGALAMRIFARRRASLERLLRDEIESRGQGAPGPAPDVIECLLAAEERPDMSEMLDELITLLLAAQEPPSIALAWLLDVLGRHRYLGSEYLRAGPASELGEGVLAESLRLRPAALAALRRLREPIEAGGTRLPPGTNAMVPLPLLHRDPRFFSDPDRFDPGRWSSFAAPPAVFHPFGGGSRGCIGEPLARALVAAAVPAILATADLTPLWPRRERMALRGTVLVPHRSLPTLVADPGSR